MNSHSSLGGAAPPDSHLAATLASAVAEGWSPLLSGPLLRLALEHVQPGLRPGAVALDLGSGRGNVAAAMRRIGARALGVDVRSDVLAANRRPEVQYVAGSAEAIPLADATVDVLVSVSVLQYTHRRRALAECRRVLRPGGRFAMVENLRGNPVVKAYRLVKRVSRAGYRAHLRPRDHLSWRARHLYGAYFREVHYRAFHLLAPALLAIPALRAPAPAGGGGRLLPALSSGVRLLDDALLALPPLRHVGWLALIYGVR